MAVAGRGSGRCPCRSASNSFQQADSQPSVELSERVGQHKRHDQDARAENEHVLGLAKIEAADTADEQVTNGEVKEPPNDIDDRGGQAYTGR